MTCQWFHGRIHFSFFLLMSKRYRIMTYSPSYMGLWCMRHNVMERLYASMADWVFYTEPLQCHEYHDYQSWYSSIRRSSWVINTNASLFLSRNYLFATLVLTLCYHREYQLYYYHEYQSNCMESQYLYFHGCYVHFRVDLGLNDLLIIQWKYSFLIWDTKMDHHETASLP